MSTTDLASHSTRLQRRSRLISHVTSRLTLLRIGLFVVGYAWLLLLPWNGLSRRAWIDENALQPGQVNVEWNWGDVKAADRYLESLEGMWNRNATSEERAGYIQQAFKEMGLEGGTQQYSFVTPSGITAGTNAYALSRSARSSGTEAIVIAASWMSRQNEGMPSRQNGGTRQPNLRGIATVLALARSLPGQRLWAKDLIFLVSDSYLDGAHAWLSAYHGAEQKDMHAQPLSHPEPSGVIWTAIVLDYSGHSFSHLGLFFEGTNGRLPNQDFCNSASTIAHGMGIPWVLYDHDDQKINLKGRGVLIAVLVEVLEMIGIDVQDYLRRAMNIARNVGYQATGEPSGVHGVFHKYRIDAITMYALPARGPHGFHSLGRVVESLLRTSNNLLERLHASFFFYVFTAPGEFAEFAKYLPPIIILGLAASFGGLKLYVETGWTVQAHSAVGEKSTGDKLWVMRDRPVLEVLCIMAATHLAGLATLAIVNRSWFWHALEEFNLSDALDLLSFPSIITIFIIWVYAHILFPRENLDSVTAPASGPGVPTKPSATPSKVARSPEKKQAEQPPKAKNGTTNTTDTTPIITLLSPLFALPQFPILPPATPALLKALNLCMLGALVSVLAVANFSLAAAIAVLAILPLCSIPVSLHLPDDENKAPEVGWRGLGLEIAGTPITLGDVVRWSRRIAVGAWVAAISPVGLLALARRFVGNVVIVEWMKRMVWESAVLKTWFVPIICVLYLPLVLQGFIVCLLPM